MIRIVVKIGSQIIVNNEKEKTNSILEKLVEDDITNDVIKFKFRDISFIYYNHDYFLL